MSARNSYNVAPIPGDNGNGGGGGGGHVNSINVPLGTIVLNAFGGSSDPDWLVCDATEYRIDTNNFQLFNAMGWSYSVNTAIETAQLRNYSYTGSTITFTTSTGAFTNQVISVGSFVKPYNFITATGADINGTIIQITSCPAINTTTSTNYVGTFVTGPPGGTGTGNTAGGSGTYALRWSFNVPNLSGRFPFGFNAAHPLRSTGGNLNTTLTAANLPQHRHGTPVPGSSSAIAGSNLRAGTFNVDDGTTTFANETYLEDGTTLAGNTAFTNLPPYLSLNYLIKSTA
jgi:microcystin-dependent protein